jgi:hypothetical protein
VLIKWEDTVYFSLLFTQLGNLLYSNNGTNFEQLENIDGSSSFPPSPPSPHTFCNLKGYLVLEDCMFLKLLFSSVRNNIGDVRNRLG